MFKKFVTGLKKRAKATKVAIATTVMTATATTMCFASGSPTSLLPAEAKTQLTGFAAQVLPTVLEIMGIVVGVGLSVWGASFGVKKGIAFLQKKASKAL